tara:strand:+ start:485 stop:739 length:255 start_codon:yes stop_codon:yes gene_type:complete
MFENFGTAIVQAVGFFGVFGFFVYRLLSEKNFTSNSGKENTKNKSSKSFKKVIPEKKGLFGRKKNVEQNTSVKVEENKRGWFKR